MKEQSLKVKTNLLPQSRISIELDIPSSSCKSIVEETIKNISRSVKLPGFRSGKIPKQVLIQRIGLSQLHASALEKIIDKCGNKESQDIEVLLNERQMSNLRDSLKNLNDTSNIIDKKLPFDFLAIELRDSIKNLAKLTGEELTEELLDNIFSKFCIGK